MVRLQQSITKLLLIWPFSHMKILKLASSAQVASPWNTVELCHSADLNRDVNTAQFDNPMHYNNQTLVIAGLVVVVHFIIFVQLWTITRFHRRLHASALPCQS